ncbi:hypothetical protein GF348_11685 [candidate division KSB3 bacterium]|nr:hypothetical protein [candidate division KSB3 bacterium]
MIVLKHFVLKRGQFLTAICFLWTFFAVFHAHPAEPQWRPEQLLPEQTLAVVVLPDLQASAAQVQQAFLAQGLRADQQKLVADSLRQEWAYLLEAFHQHTGLSLFVLEPLWKRRFALALLDLAGPEVSAHSDQLSPHIACIADVAGSTQAVKTLLETRLVPHLQHNDPTFEFSVESFAGHDVYLVANDQCGLYYTFLDNTFVLTLQSESIQKIIFHADARLHAPIADPVEGYPRPPARPYMSISLWDAPAYQRALRKPGAEDHAVRLYVNVRKLWEQVGAAVRRPLSPATSGLLTMMMEHTPAQTFGWTLSVRHNGGYEHALQVEAETVSDTQGASFAAVHTDNGPFSSARLAPADAIFYGVNRVNWHGLWQELTAVIRALPDSQRTEHVEAGVSTLEKLLQGDAATQLLSALGPEVALIGEAGGTLSRSPRTPEEFPYVLLVEVRQRTHFEQTVRHLATTLWLERRSQQVQQTRVDSLTAPGAGITLHTAYVHDFWLVSCSRKSLSRVIAAAQHGNGLAAADEYRTLSSFFPQRGYAKGYLNLKHVAKILRHEMAGQRQTVSEQGPPTPVLELLEQSKSPAGLMWVSSRVPEGWVTESWSPFGGILAGAALFWLGLDYLL